MTVTCGYERRKQKRTENFLFFTNPKIFFFDSSQKWTDLNLAEIRYCFCCW